MTMKNQVEQNLKTVSRQLECYNKRDLDGFCACYHPEICVEWILSQKVVSRGMADFRMLYQDLFLKSPQLHCELKHRTVLEHSVIDEEFVTGIPGIPSGLHTVAIYGFRDGLIDKVWFVR